MKLYLNIFLFFLLQEFDVNTQVIYVEDGKSYTDSSFSKIYDGEIIEKYENGNIKRIGHYLNGRANGEFTTFYPNGQLNSKSFYLNGKEQGECILFFENGKTLYKIR